MLDEVSAMLIFASIKLLHRPCSSLVDLDQSSGSRIDQQMPLQPILLVRQQHLGEQQLLVTMMMMTCTIRSTSSIADMRNRVCVFCYCY